MSAFLGDISGVSAIEFALIVPVMLVVYLAGFEMTQVIALDRLVALTSGTVTNLASQYTTISASSQMPDILAASSQVLSPYSASSASVTISSITIDASGGAVIAWSQALNGAPRTVGQAVNLPAALDIPSSTLLMGETRYAYRSPVDYINIGTMNLYHAIYMLPRASTTINLTP